VQNTGSAAVDVTVTYVGTPAATCTDTATAVEPGAAATFKQDESTCLVDGFIGAATVSSTGEIAVAVVQHDAQSLLSYNGFTSAGSQAPVMPLVSHSYYNSRTALQIQNTGGTDTDVTVSYSPSAGFPGAACSETKTVPAGGSANFGDSTLFEDVSEPCGPMGYGATLGFVGSAKVISNTTSQNLVAIVNSVTTGTPNGAAYSAFDPAAASSNVNMPLIMDRNYGIFTGYSVANVGTDPTDIDCTYSGSTVTSSADDVAPGASLTVVTTLGGEPIADGYVGSATCVASGGTDNLIVGVVSQLGTTGDALLYYEAFNY
jgi:hypothetical protein